ncbi:MAG: L,D-transpeptidase family protein [Hyphomicrobiaceae bacterium]|nr:L,D-transpeptidase family protein [Hyphomicrobiaceae bacterium]
MAGTIRIGAVAATLACALTAPAVAYDGESWMRFGSRSTTASIDQPYDHSFARQWEANPPKGFPTLAPGNIAAMKVAITRYTLIVERGGWPTLPDATLQPGSGGPAVEALRQRLSISGDLRSVDAGGFSTGFDGGLEKAVKRFQASNGLTPTGIVDKRTIAALNVPAVVRLKQLKTNLGRLQELSRSAGKRYIVVNIPAAQIEAIENDRVVSRHAGVVGKLDRQTPILKSAVHELNFNPVWHLPPTVITKDLIPKAREMQRKGLDVLAKYHIEAYGSDGKKLDSTKINWSNLAVQGLTYRQQPGPENPLGFVKINFHNAHSVYMHDTPSQTLFGRNFRAASSGCVRISGIETLAAWIGQEQGWTEEKVRAMKKSGERLDLRLKKPVPLYFAYITAWATEDGVIQFRRDIYDKDGVGAVASAY